MKPLFRLFAESTIKELFLLVSITYFFLVTGFASSTSINLDIFHNLKMIVNLFFLKIESEKYDLEWSVRVRDVEVRELLEKVNNFRGKL